MSDTFHRAYRELTDAEKTRIEDIKNTAEELLTHYCHISKLIYEHPERVATTEWEGANSKEIDLAIVKLEESVMWAVKAITK